MTSRADALKYWARLTWRGVVALGFAAGVVVLMLWLAGKFEAKVPTEVAEGESPPAAVAGQVVAARTIRLPLWESAVGTIRAVHETSIGSKLLARVVEVKLKAGQKVRAGEVLLRLDDTDLRAKLEQARAAVASAEAARTQAAADAERFGQLIKSRAISQQQYEQSLTAVKSAEAALRQLQQVATEVQATLDWATVRSPIDGTVIDKRVDVGDMVSPGQILVTLFDPERMQLVASVRESLAHQLQVGQDIPVRLDTFDKQCSGTVSEIVPEAHAASRAFQVKVTGPCPPGVYTGMFGRLMIPLGEEQVLVIPRRAVRNVGQLELVDVVEAGRPVRRAVRTGRTVEDGQVEILSGLREGEQVVIPAPKESRQNRRMIFICRERPPRRSLAGNSGASSEGAERHRGGSLNGTEAVPYRVMFATNHSSCCDAASNARGLQPLGFLRS